MLVERFAERTSVRRKKGKGGKGEEKMCMLFFSLFPISPFPFRYTSRLSAISLDKKLNTCFFGCWLLFLKFPPRHDLDDFIISEKSSPMKGRFLKRNNLWKTLLTNLQRAMSRQEFDLSKSKKHAEHFVKASAKNFFRNLAKWNWRKPKETSKCENAKSSF